MAFLLLVLLLGPKEDMFAFAHLLELLSQPFVACSFVSDLGMLQLIGSVIDRFGEP